MQGLINSTIQEEKCRILLSYDTKIGPRRKKTRLRGLPTTKVQTSLCIYLRSLISAFVSLFLESIISKLVQHQEFAI